MNEIKVIAIGTSAGGVQALQRIFETLPESLQTPIVIVQHLPSDAVIDVHLAFGRFSKRPMIEVNDKMTLESGGIYFAPAGYHLLLESDMTFSLTQDDPVNFARPSIDVFFQSAALAGGKNICGVLLTGANGDGALGLKEIANEGGVTIVQDPRDAEIPYMPKAALEILQPNFILDVSSIGPKLNELGGNK